METSIDSSELWFVPDTIAALDSWYLGINRDTECPNGYPLPVLRDRLFDTTVLIDVRTIIKSLDTMGFQKEKEQLQQLYDRVYLHWNELSVVRYGLDQWYKDMKAVLGTLAGTSEPVKEEPLETTPLFVERVVPRPLTIEATETDEPWLYEVPEEVDKNLIGKRVAFVGIIALIFGAGLYIAYRKPNLLWHSSRSMRRRK